MGVPKPLVELPRAVCDPAGRAADLLLLAQLDDTTAFEAYFRVERDAYATFHGTLVQMEKRLRLWGVIADSTYSGKEALAMMRNQSAMGMPYDFIIIDHDMPMMSGLQLSERLQADDEISPKPASLMLTGLSVSATENAARQAGFVKTIAKPVSGNRLREALVDILTLRRQSSNRSSR